MNAARVILVTVAGPAGQMDIGVRSDATPSELAASLGSMLGVSLTRSVAEHRSPSRPGSRQGQRAMLSPGTSLAAAGVADGDLVLFRRTEDGLGRAPAPPRGVLRNPVPAAPQPGLPHGTRPSQAGPPRTAPLPGPPRTAPLPRADSLPRAAPAPRATPAPQPDPRDGVPRLALPRHARANGPADTAAAAEEETRPHDRH